MVIVEPSVFVTNFERLPEILRFVVTAVKITVRKCTHAPCHPTMRNAGALSDCCKAPCLTAQIH